MMATLKAHQPYANYFVNGRTYTANEQSLIEARGDDAPALINCGCVVTEPFSIALPRADEKPIAPTKPATIRLKGRAGAAYQPETGSRYTADGEGFVEIPVHHVKALLRMGCSYVDEEGREFGISAPAA